MYHRASAPTTPPTATAYGGLRVADDAEDRRAALAAATAMASRRGDIGLHRDSERHWLTLADEAYRWLRDRPGLTAKESTVTEDAAAAEDVTAAEDAPAEDTAGTPEAEDAGDAPEGDAPDAGPAA
jgi:hypothetical protein